MIARGGGEVHKADLGSITSAFIRLAQGMMETIWLDLGALNQGYIAIEHHMPPFFNKLLIHTGRGSV